VQFEADPVEVQVEEAAGVCKMVGVDVSSWEAGVAVAADIDVQGAWKTVA
jgi:hypothetical protein